MDAKQGTETKFMKIDRKKKKQLSKNKFNGGDIFPQFDAGESLPVNPFGQAVSLGWAGKKMDHAFTPLLMT